MGPRNISSLNIYNLTIVQLAKIISEWRVQNNKCKDSRKRYAPMLLRPFNLRYSFDCSFLIMNKHFLKHKKLYYMFKCCFETINAHCIISNNYYECILCPLLYKLISTCINKYKSYLLFSYSRLYRYNITIL